MGDIRLIWNPATGFSDINMIGPLLETGHDLETAILISFWSDHVADPGDSLPVDTNKDPRGWWADTYEAPDEIGSKLWQVFNRPRNQDTLNFAGDCATKALQWLIDDGVAASVAVAPSFYGSGGIATVTTVTAPDGSVTKFSHVWGQET
jgi:phage gp46-like protein